MAVEPIKAARELWQLHLQEKPRLDRIYDHMCDRDGLPVVPSDASDEVKRIARMSALNVLGLVRDSFAQNLSVVGYRSSTTGDDLAPWELWQKNRMDARQAEIFRPALTYGCSYAAVLPGEHGPVFRPRSPRQLLAAYSDPQLDDWPEIALETWVEVRGDKRFRRGFLYTSDLVYPLDLGVISDTNLSYIAPSLAGEPFEHGVDVCPIVRFVSSRDGEGAVVGEVEPLLTLQREINNVNFDRLIVSRFGAFPQKVITGWSGTSDEVLAASARRVWAFEDSEVDAKSFPAADPAAYTAVLNDLFEHVAMVAQISPSQVTGQIINVSAEALAAAEANQQRKLVSLRESFGESMEQMLRLGALMSGDSANAVDELADVVWRDTEARSLGAVVDAVTKLAATGVPVTQLLHMVPGMTQRQIQEIDRSLRSKAVLDRLTAVSAEAQSDPSVANLAARNDDSGDV